MPKHGDEDDSNSSSIGSSELSVLFALKLAFGTDVMVTEKLDVRLAAPSSNRRAARQSAKSF